MNKGEFNAFMAQLKQLQDALDRIEGELHTIALSNARIDRKLGKLPKVQEGPRAFYGGNEVVMKTKS